MPALSVAQRLAFLAVVALGLRLASVAVLGIPDLPVTYEHGEIARNLLTGRGFAVRFLGVDGPTSQQAPLYPCLLAGLYWIWGVDSQAALLALFTLQSLAGTGLVLAVYWLGRGLAPHQPSAAWWAALAAAFYPPHLYLVTHVQVALWAALVLTVALALAISPRWGGQPRKAVALGCLAGGLLLIEPILALALPPLAILFWRQERSTTAGRASSLRRLALLTCVAGLTVLPWVVRNARVHGEFVFIKSTFGYAFWQGNNPVSHGTDKVPKPNVTAIRTSHDGSLRDINRALWEARHETIYIDDLLLKPYGYAEFAGLSEPARSRRLSQRAWAFIRAQPTQYLRLCRQRLQYFLWYDQTNPKATHPLYQGVSLAWLMFTCAGVVTGLTRWRHWWPTWLLFASVACFHTLTIVSARFRVPLEPLSFVWAGAALSLAGARCGHYLQAWRTRSEGAALTAPPVDHSLCPGQGR